MIACDTAVNHLAGALGVPAWLPLNLVPDWRWGVQGEGNVWYLSVRLFRQTELGQWEPVFARMAEALAALAGGRPAARALRVEVAPGELIAKITILEIKARRIAEPARRANVRAELEALTAARDRALPRSAELDRLTEELRAVNEVLWDVEDAIRTCERAQDFGARFVELARAVYHNNDRRAASSDRSTSCSARSWWRRRATPPIRREAAPRQDSGERPASAGWSGAAHQPADASRSPEAGATGIPI